MAGELYPLEFAVDRSVLADFERVKKISRTPNDAETFRVMLKATLWVVENLEDGMEIIAQPESQDKKKV